MATISLPRVDINAESSVRSAASASGTIFMILELDQPFGGLIQVSAGPLRSAAVHLGQ